MKEFTYKANSPVVNLFNIARAIRQCGIDCKTKDLRAFAENAKYPLLNNGKAVHAEDAALLGKEYIETHPTGPDGIIPVFPKPERRVRQDVRDVPAILLDTIFGNRVSIIVSNIVEMCWYSTGYAIIFTGCGQYIARMTREDFDRLNEMRVAG